MKPDQLPNKVAVAMLGARMHYAVPRLLHEAGQLDRFFTDSYIGNKPKLESLLRRLARSHTVPNFLSRWLGRSDPHLSPQLVTSFEGLGFWYAFARRRASTLPEQEQVGVKMAQMFNARVLKHGFGAADAVFGFNAASVELFRAAKAQGRRCILEQTILPHKIEVQLLAEVAADWPDWQPGFLYPDVGQQTVEREAEEWVLADKIIVGSAFVRHGLIACGVPDAKITVVPYGIDPCRFTAHRARENRNGPLRVLFVGEVGLRKGAPYLLEALRRLGPDRVQARFAGGVALQAERLSPYAAVAHFLGAVPRNQMNEHFQWADVFVLPSIVEGSAISSYEALLCGLPIIVTPNTGTVIDGEDAGQIVPIRDIDALESAILRYCDDRDLLNAHVKGARNLKGRVSIERYCEELLDTLNGRESEKC